MTRQETVDVLIVGSGPAGMSTALHLIQHDPAWAGRVVVVEKAVHPREKLCGGGVTLLGERVLSDLGLSYESHHVPVRELHVVCQHRRFAIQADPVFRVVRRDEFDQWLMQCGERRGITVRQGEAVTDIILRDDAVEVYTTKTMFRAKMIVAADGSNSTVRQKLKLPHRPTKAHTLEILTPEQEDTISCCQGIVEYDFTTTFKGLQGYYWNIPCRIQGNPFMSRGMFTIPKDPVHQDISIKQIFQQMLARYGKNLKDSQLRGFPIQLFDKNGIFAVPRILFAGDAAGVDPFFGEGISFALAYGQIAAQELRYAFDSHDFTAATYNKRIFTHPILGTLGTRRHIAQGVYTLSLRHPWLAGKMWDMMPWSVRVLFRFRPHIMQVKHPRIKGN